MQIALNDNFIPIVFSHQNQPVVIHTLLDDEHEELAEAAKTLREAGKIEPIVQRLLAEEVIDWEAEGGALFDNNG